MEMVDVLGFVAASLTTGAFVPQVVKTARTKSAGDISLGMYCALGAGLCLWLLYGVLTRSVPVILANGVTFILSCVMIAFKLRKG